MICCSDLRTLGFVMRLAKYFGLESSLKALYCSIVRPILEYGAKIWDPHTAVNARQLERVQRRFFRFASYLLGIDCPPHDYTPVATNLGLVTLAERRCYFGNKFLKDLLTGVIDYPSLLALVTFKVPQRSTHYTPMFHIPFSATNYMQNEPVRPKRDLLIDWSGIPSAGAVPVVVIMNESDTGPQMSLFSTDDVARAVSKIPSGKAPGPDLVPNELIKLAFKKFPQMIVGCYNACLEKAEFPS
ncbi:hypothetical protein QTP88_002143 [Uroleucon formosanum]